MGTIRLDVAAEVPEGASNEHQLFYRNDYEPVKSKYMVNAFKTTGEIEIAQQDRDTLQHGIRVDYSATPDAPAASDANDASEVDQATGGVSERAQRLVGYLYEPALSPWLLVVGLGLSALLGGLHALTPGPQVTERPWSPPT